MHKRVQLTDFPQLNILNNFFHITAARPSFPRYSRKALTYATVAVRGSPLIYCFYEYIATIENKRNDEADEVFEIFQNCQISSVLIEPSDLSVGLQLADHRVEMS